MHAQIDNTNCIMIYLITRDDGDVLGYSYLYLNIIYDLHFNTKWIYVYNGQIFIFISWLCLLKFYFNFT